MTTPSQCLPTSRYPGFNDIQDCQFFPKKSLLDLIAIMQFKKNQMSMRVAGVFTWLAVLFRHEQGRLCDR